MLPERTREQRGGDPPCKRRSSRSIIGLGTAAQGCYKSRARIAVKLFDHGRLIQRRLERGAAPASRRPFLGCVDEVAPAIFASTRSFKENVYAPVIPGLSSHVASFRSS